MKRVYADLRSGTAATTICTDLCRRLIYKNLRVGCDTAEEKQKISRLMFVISALSVGWAVRIVAILCNEIGSGSIDVVILVNKKHRRVILKT